MRKKLSVPKNVLFLGIVSFFNDVASEMIYPVMPIFLTSVLGAPASILGFIEGFAEATASIMKFISGYISDKMQKRKGFVICGYGLSAISKIIIALATTWPMVLVAKFIDRFGKGIRTTARDSLLLENTTPTDKGFIFGFHRALDSLGAFVGPIIALILLSIYHDNIRIIFHLAIIPPIIGLGALILFVREKKKEKKPQQVFSFHFSWKIFDPRFKLFLVSSIIFSLGNSSDAFLILRSKELGLTTTLIVGTYILYNLFQTLFATPAGELADRIGPKRVYSMGLVIFALVYFVFGLMKNPILIWIMYPIYGMYIAFTDGVSKAYLSEFTTKETSGSYFGFYQTVIAFCTFFASFFGGILWTKFFSGATFYYGAVMALLAFGVLKTSRLK